MQVVEVRDPDDYRNLPDAWRSLWAAQRAAPLFLHPVWSLTWWQTFGTARSLRLLIVEDDGRIVGLAPLFQEGAWPIPGRLRSLGVGTSDYADWLLGDDPTARERCLEALWLYLARRPGWSALQVDGLLPESSLLRPAHLAALVPLFRAVRRGLPCPAVELRGTWTDYLATRPSRLRYNLRSRTRRLEELGRLEYVHANTADAASFVDEAIELHHRRWLGQHTSTIFSSSARGRSFYRSVLPEMVGEGLADLAALRIDGRTIATSVGFIHNRRYLYYLPAWDPEFAVYAPSTLLLAHLLEEAFDDRLECFDFMLGDEEYKQQWATTSRNVHTLLLAPRTFAGRTALTLLVATGRARSVARTSTRLQRLRRYGLGAFRASLDTVRESH